MYREEFGKNWLPLTAACLGMGVSASLSHYTLGLFAPPLLAEFGWSKADFALIGVLALVNVLLLPATGHLVDRFGSSICAAIGFTVLPLSYLALASMTGSLAAFFAIWIVLQMFGVLTSTLVFCRVVVERFDRARGAALSLVMTGAPLGAAIATPLLAMVIETHGWRTAYVVLAGLSAVGGLLAVLTIRGTPAPAAQAVAPKLRWTDLARLLRDPAFVLLLLGMFLVNVPQVFASSQLKLFGNDNGLSDHATTWMISVYAIGVVAGRFASGLAVDRLRPNIVALVILALPAAGYMILFSSWTALPVFISAVALLGIAQGAEGDLGAYLVAKVFDPRNFSLLMSLMLTMVAVGSAAGSLILRQSLQSQAGGYGLFLIVCAGATLLGALSFGFTGTWLNRAGDTSKRLAS